MTKPIVRPVYMSDGKYIDNIAECGYCGTFICYPTEHDAQNEYKYCHKCGAWIDWEGVTPWKPLSTQPEHKTYVEGLMVGNGREWKAELWHEAINGKSIYYDEKGFQVNPILWRPL